LLGLVGDDANGLLLKSQLQAANITCYFQQLPHLPTITKLRIVDRQQQLIRLDFEEPYYHVETPGLLEDFKAQLPHVGVVILSDYGKGALSAVKELISTARAANVPVLVDPKSKDFSIYRGATLVTPNLKEFRAVVGDWQSEEELISKGNELLRAYQFQALLITRSEQGMTLLQEGQPALNLPTRAREVYDVSGAGDTAIAILAAALAVGQSLPVAATLANVAAGIVVRKFGTATVSVPELRRALQRYSDAELGILSEKQLLIAVADARAHGETIVMTNGCFDILHAGHVAYLEEAKGLGKRLIVAINDDASVVRLKGAERPINKLPHRMNVIAALRAVDWVVAFSEDTPQRLISQVLPDTLVKGGDYQHPEEIAGAKEVLANGGEVKILPFHEGHSTTRLVKKIRDCKV
ncbi:MAG: bifunctional D-glycero-beta-D-manno-heptose-7-phosphate kinase/D-glycero-beta-D-manno-heptose 1-phosphate adenylyltransferase HldE, partial [Gammaproteobacteria bacterium]